MTNERLQHMLDAAQQSIGPILHGTLLYTIPISLISFAIGLVLAILVALANLSDYSLFNKPARFFVWIIRGTPILVQMFIVFYGLPNIGVVVEPFPTAILIFSLNEAAYNSEILRAAILSIPKGQWRAGESIGMSYAQVLRRIILPQAARVSVPPLGNAFIGLFKSTSLVTLITIADLFGAAKLVAASTFEPMKVYVIAALFYLFFCSLLSLGQTQLEKKFGKHVM